MAEMISGARQWVDLPDPEPLGGGVISVATVIDNPDPHALMGVIAESDACATGGFVPPNQFCMGFGGEKPPKEFADEPTFMVGDPFAVYAGVACPLQHLDEARARAEKRLTYSEGRDVDMALADVWNGDPEVVSLGGPYPVNQAIGVAEAFAASFYGGRPTLFLPRQFVPCACGCGALRTNLDGTLTTCAGSAVAPVTTFAFALPPVTATMFVTGRLVLLRGSVNSYSVPQQIFDDGTFAPPRALAERIYLPVYDCLIAKVEVSCEEPATP